VGAGLHRREITSAARLGGGSPEANPRLRLAIQKSREVNLPKDSLDKAIKRGTGELEGVAFEEMTIEGYGPGGVAIICTILTDNRNRAAADVRYVFTKNGGSLAQPIAGEGEVNVLEVMLARPSDDNRAVR
jgi:transcriptional/translational regulatory protein YebC/TACO1